MTVRTVNSREMRAHLRDVLDHVLKGGDVCVERNGKAVAVLIPPEDYQKLVDRLNDLREGRQTMIVFEEKQDMSSSKSIQDVQAEFITEELLDPTKNQRRTSNDFKDKMMIHISVDPKIHFGKPCVAGARIPVQNVLELLNEGKTFDQIVGDYYPDLTVEDVRACIYYAIALIESEEIHIKASSL
jgi:prevent-host-death family protein